MNTCQDYRKRINKVIQYIEDNFSEKLTIDELSGIANYSKYHFNRVFKSVTNENVYSFIKRIRLERANCYLWRSEYSISEIAEKCGFLSSSNFSYNYKKHFGLSAKEQLKVFEQHKDPDYIPDISVEFVKKPPIKLAYIKRFGKLNCELYSEVKKLHSWAEARDLWSDNSKFIFIIYDSLYVTKPENVRCDICLTVPDDAIPSGDINIMDLPGVKMASTEVLSVPGIDIINKFFDELANWLLNSSYQLDGFEYIFFRKGVVPEPESIIEFEVSTPVSPR